MPPSSPISSIALVMANAVYKNPSLASPQIEVDPDNTGDIYRVAVLVESLFNIIGGAVLILRPRAILTYLLPTYSSVPQSSIQLIQWLGILTFALTPQLILSIPNTKGAIEGRRMAYITLLAGEVGLVAAMGGQMMMRTEGITERSFGVMMVMLGGIVPWRLYALYVRPEVMGRYREKEEGRKRE